MVYYPLTAKLLQPHILALLSSIGIHVLLFQVSSPELEEVSSQPEEALEKRTVKLVQLNATEQERTPNIQSIPPNASIQSRFTNIPNYQSLIPNPLQQSNYPSYIPPSQIPLPDPLPLPQSNYSRSSYPPPPPPSLPQDNPPELNLTPPPQETAITTPKPNPPQPIEEDIQKQELVAKRQENLLTEVQLLAEKLQLKETNTTRKEARKNYVNWIVSIKEVKPEQIQIEGNYPQDACIPKLTGTTVYGIVVDSIGKVIDLQLIQSSGYSLFNEQAIADIKNHTFENQLNKNKPYLVFVNYEHDRQICPSLSRGENP